MSQDSVRALPLQARSAMSLEEIRAAMIDAPPNLDGFVGGWASIENHQSNLGLAGVEPPKSVPAIEPGCELLPRTLRARFYYWDPTPSGLANPDPLATRRLNAIDVIITQPATGRIGALFSTRTTAYLNKRRGVIASLNGILQSKDPNSKIERGESHLQLSDEEIFLWLAVQHRDKPQLAADIRLDQIAGISSRDSASRTADLRFGVDFDRSNFLTAVAEKDTLGPIDICFVQHVETENHSYEVRLHIDGGFEISKKRLHFPDSLNRPELMLETSLFLAYSMIPRLNELYQGDAARWSTQRFEVIQNAMTALEERYKSLHAVLQRQLDETPA